MGSEKHIRAGDMLVIILCPSLHAIAGLSHSTEQLMDWSIMM